MFLYLNTHTQNPSLEFFSSVGFFLLYPYNFKYSKPCKNLLSSFTKSKRKSAEEPANSCFKD